MGCNLCKNEISPHHGNQQDDIEMTKSIIDGIEKTDDQPIQISRHKLQPSISHASSLTARTRINTDHPRTIDNPDARNNGPHQYANTSESFQTISDIQSDASSLHENAHTQQPSQLMKTTTPPLRNAFVQKGQKSKVSQSASSGFHKMNRKNPGTLRSSTPVFGSKESDRAATNFSTQTTYPFGIHISPIQNVSDDEIQSHHRILVVKRNRKLAQHTPRNSTPVNKDFALPDGDDDKHQLISKNTSKIPSVKLMQQILQNDLKSRTDERQKSEFRKALRMRKFESSSDDD